MTCSKRTAAGRRASRLSIASGMTVMLAYLAGAALSGQLSPLARRPLLDGLAPPPPYRWVKPPPELSSGNRPPSGATSTVPLGPAGSSVTAISTSDGQANLVMEAGAIAPAAGQRSGHVAMSGLVLAGNAYRVRFSYQPSGRPVKTPAGRSTVSLIYPVLPIPVSSPFDYAILSSTDGRAWARQSSTATPGSHQVSSTLPAPGYVIAAVPRAPAEQAAPNRTPLFAGLAAAAALIAVAAIALARRLRAERAGGDDDHDEDDDDDYDYDDEEDPEGPDPGSEERR